MVNYFGKDCEFFCGQWEYDVMEFDDYTERFEPILVFCNHSKNIEDTEGNCRKDICPLEVLQKGIHRDTNNIDINQDEFEDFVCINFDKG